MTKVQRSKYEMLCAPAQQIVAVWKAKVREVPRVARALAGRYAKSVSHRRSFAHYNPSSFDDWRLGRIGSPDVRIVRRRRWI